MKLDKETLDKLEHIFLEQLLDPNGTVPAAKLDIIRKSLERNNRLYVRPQPGDASPTLDAIRRELEDENQGPGPIILPFKVPR